MNVQITRIDKSQKELFLNLYNLYLYDLSEFSGEDLLEEGKFDPTNTYLYLERAELYPFFIQYEEKIIGFVLVCSPPYVDDDVDFTVQELFLAKKYRGQGLAAQAVDLVFAQFQGKFKVEQLAYNRSAVSFWKKYYEHHHIEYVESEYSIEIENIAGSHRILSQTFGRARMD
ncbi:GNAT family N-acetyltransferase [Paenibacillus taichungensis]|uniref:GNAT family N-acetyltransferase n=1 Tax=Paenibacillus taichungensis TaxID=484184 RepID=UPI002872A7CE|nr:GNAT family N-acetyltransferase [Paenibacillus taichungensis]MDR9744466.1 GNAT family N-acetyltransferase [Paenibacillus taichungensis]